MDLLRGNQQKTREETNVSQAQFSEIVGIPQYRLSGLELGKDVATDGEIEKIVLAIEKIKKRKIKLRKKKRISKEVFDCSIVATNPRRDYAQTDKNVEYRKLLQNLEAEFNKDHSQDPKVISFFAGCGGLCYI